MHSKIPKMLTIKEAAKQSGIAETRVRALCWENKIVHLRCGTKYLINFDRFVDYLNGVENVTEN